MARDLTSAMVTAVTADNLPVVLLFEGEFATDTVRVWTGYGEITWDGKTWQGVGHLGGVSPVEETDDTEARGIVVQLAGVPSELVSIALGEARQGKPGTVYFGVLKADGTLEVDPYRTFLGRLDVPIIEDGGETATISISYESRLIDLERPRIRRNTSADQQLDYPGDLGFNQVEGLVEEEFVWGRR